jgi:hypothetical protein
MGNNCISGVEENKTELTTGEGIYNYKKSVNLFLFYFRK